MLVQLRDEGLTHHQDGIEYTRQHGPFELPDKCYPSLQDKVEKVEPEPKKYTAEDLGLDLEEEPKTYPYHYGGGNYELSDGSTVKGKENAKAAEAALQEATDDRMDG